MAFFLSLFFSLFGLIFRKNKFLFGLILLYLWIMSSFNFYIADKGNYYNNYLSSNLLPGFLNTEIGQEVTYKISGFLGLDFSTYLGIYYLVGLLLIARIINKYSLNPNIVLVFYFIYPFIIDVAQIRNFMSMAIMLNAIPFLMTNNRIDIIKYVAMITIAISFHHSAVFYLLFIIIKFFNKKSMIKIVSIVVIVGYFFNNLFIYFLVDVFPFIEQKVNRYTGTSISFYTQIGLLIYLFSGLVLVYWTIKKYKKNQSLLPSFEAENSINYFLNIVFLINIIMFMLYPFLLYATEFIRIYRNILILNYIAFSNAISLSKIKISEEFLYVVSILLFVIVSCWFFIYYQFSETVFFPFFESNFLFK